MVVPSETLEDKPSDSKPENQTKIFKGSQKPVKGNKECLLIFDRNTNELRIEKLASNIHVKQTRYY